MSTLLPLYDRVLVRVAKKKDTSEAGIALVHRREEEANVGVVVAVGPGAVAQGVRLPMSVEPGDQVIFEEGKGVKLTYAGEDLLRLRDQDISAVVEA